MAPKEKHLRLTKKLIKQYFDYCNDKYFDGKVESPSCFDTWTPNKNIAGWVRAIWNKNTQTWDSALHISNRFNWTEKNLIDTIVHEMIHLEAKDYLEKISWWRRLFHRDHNENFFKRMDELNLQFPELNVVLKAKHLRKERKKRKK